MDKLEQIHGLGKMKLEKFGPELLTQLSLFQRSI
ncbi:hypothetical protein [Pseudomonas sp. GW460-C8]